MGEDGSSGGAMARRLAEPSGGEGGEGGGVMPIERGGGGVRGASRCILSFRGPGALGVVVLHGGEGGGEAGAKTGVSGRPLGSVAMSRGVTLDASRAMDSKEEMPKAGT